MWGIELDAIFKRLHPHLTQVLEAAASLCKVRGNSRLEPAHWLQETLQQQDSDLARVIRYFALNEPRLLSDLVAAGERLPRAQGVGATFSADLLDALQGAWLFASLSLRHDAVRGGHLLYAYLASDHRYKFLAISAELAKIRVDELKSSFDVLTKGSPEALPLAEPRDEVAAGTTAPPSEASASAARARTKALDQYTVDLTARAEKGEIDKIFGRDAEIRQMIDILLRRRQNNPILVGEAGVGKTAVVEGFVHRILTGEVPPELRRVRVRALDVGLLQAGASMRGEFEQRLRSVIDEVQTSFQQSAQPVILFIDEVHTLIGAGGSAGTGDAANLLKPALARGTLRTIAATTWDEYRKYIEKDPALSRRFQAINVDEPFDARCVSMLRSVVEPFEKHHQVEILEEAVVAAVSLSQRFIPARQLPDKAVALLDTACARVAVSQKGEPSPLDDCRARLRNLREESAFLEREISTGVDHQARFTAIRQNILAEEARQKDLTQRWSEEKDVVNNILHLRRRLSPRLQANRPARDGQPHPSSAATDQPDPKSAVEDLAKLGELTRQLASMQGEDPLVLATVDNQVVARIVSEWTGIPAGRMLRDEVQQVLTLPDRLERRVIGQRHALELIASGIQTNKARLQNPNRPVGVFMLVGPSGTGKTETALALAEALYGGEKNLIVINMSEFQEKHTVSTLKGSPPGYVGYGEGGVLTEAVRRRPYSVVLLDEVEKAHRDVHEIFFQVFDKGWMEDAEGRYIDFKNTIVILTTNAAQEIIVKQCGDPEAPPSSDTLEKALRDPLIKIFQDALLNRLTVVPYYPITTAILDRIIRINLGRLEVRIRENHAIPFTYTEAVPRWIADKCRQLERGARIVDALISSRILPLIAREYLSRVAISKPIPRVHLDIAADNPVLNLDGEAPVALPNSA